MSKVGLSRHSQMKPFFPVSPSSEISIFHDNFVISVYIRLKRKKKKSVIEGGSGRENVEHLSKSPAVRQKDPLRHLIYHVIILIIRENCELSIIITDLGELILPLRSMSKRIFRIFPSEILNEIKDKFHAISQSGSNCYD